MQHRIYHIALFCSLLCFCHNVSGRNINSQSETFNVYVVQQRWHTGIILKTEDINIETWPDTTLFRNKKYIDISWGDEKFYQSRGTPFFLAARAILWPTQSVIRVFPFELPLRSAYGKEARIITLTLNQNQHASLTKFIADSFIPGETGKLVNSTVYEKSEYFFLSLRKYHLFRTCNTWAALAFKNSGFDIRSCLILNANQLFRQLEKIPSAKYVK